MGTFFEELIRKVAELSNETAGEHFTPREVIRLMVNLLFIENDDLTEAVKEYIHLYKESPKPFVWKAKAIDILEKVMRARTAQHKLHSA